MGVRFVEMRKSPRIEVNAAAKIIIMSNGFRIKHTLDCRVVNISAGGALIVSENPITASEFYLETSKHAGLQLCSVVRRESLHRVGVQFLGIEA